MSITHSFILEVIIILSIAAYNRVLSVLGLMLSRLVTPALFEKPVRGTETVSCLGIKQRPVSTGECSTLLQHVTSSLTQDFFVRVYMQIIKNFPAFMEPEAYRSSNVQPIVC